MRTDGSGLFDHGLGRRFHSMGAPDQDQDQDQDQDRSDLTWNENGSDSGLVTEKSTNNLDVHDSKGPKPKSNRSRRVDAGAGAYNPPPNIQPTNWLSVNYRMPINGTYIVDPSLVMPADLIPDNPTKKANLSLECTRGSIIADVWLVDEEMSMQRVGNRLGGGGGGGGQRAVVDVFCKSWMGKVDLKLFSLTSRPFSLTVTSNGGDISVALPKDFVGPITLSTGSLYDYFRPSSFTPFSALVGSGPRENVIISNNQGSHTDVRTTPYSTSIIFSDAVKSHLVTFSEAGGKRTCFIGDYRSTGYVSRKDWTGSLVDIQSAYGNLKISFVDEEKQREKQNQGDACVVM